MKDQIQVILLSLFAALTVGEASEPALSDLTEWYVDAVNGDDANCDGSADEPFQSIDALLAVNATFPGFVGEGDTIYLAAGSYDDASIIIDIADLRIEGTLDSKGLPVSVLGDVEIVADGVTLSNCLFLDSGLTLRGVNDVSIEKNVFSGTIKNSLTLLGASQNSINGNYFESATKSCVVLRCDSKSKQSSSENIFQENYFTHHPDKGTDQVILANKNTLLKTLFGKKRLNFGNRFVNCAFEEMDPGYLKHVAIDASTWRTVADYDYTLLFEDCYFKRADRRVPFVSFMVYGETPDLAWYWDELAKDTWVTSNEGYVLTGHKSNGYTPSIRFVDSNKNGLILETKYPAGVRRLSGVPSPEQTNTPPVVINAIADIAVYENAEPSTVNLFEVFEDTVTADEDLEFTISCDNASLLSSELKEGRLTLNYIGGGVGMALVTVTATDDDSVNPLTAEDAFHVIIVEADDGASFEQSDWYIDSEAGNDESGTGIQSNPFKTIEKLLALYAEQPALKSSGSVIHLSKGNYGLDGLEIRIPGLVIEGTLDEKGRPATVLGETRITASGVQLKNCRFQDAGLTLLNVEDVLVSNNVFTGITASCLFLLGASNNTIEYNRFSSAVHDCVHIFWDSESGRSSNDNVFLRNYFTHRSDDVTRRVVRVNWSAGSNNSISARNHFIECAFEETKDGQLLRVIDDDSTWWMVVESRYSVAFEDCYFKRADRENPFSEFLILEGHPVYSWRWDELIDDDWVATNEQWGLTGDHNGWGHRPRLQFIDKNGNDKALESFYDAGLKSEEKMSEP